MHKAISKISALPDDHEDSPLHIIRPMSEEIKSFPSTRYYGSKRKLLHWIYSNISTLNFDTVLDAFGGTGSVSLLFKAMRKSVTYHDGFRFNEDVGRTVLANDIACTKMELQEFLNEISPRKGTISGRFNKTFYTDDENSWLDGFIGLLTESEFDAQKSSLMRYLVYQACLKKRPFNLFHRANLGLRTKKNVDRSFGNFVTWERTFEHHMVQAFDELQKSTRPFRGQSTVLPSRNAEEIPAGFDLVYIDPPYVNLKDRYNRDDYWKRYHFLEGLARYNEWGKLIDPESKIGQFEAPKWMTEWSRIDTFSERLFSFIEKHSSSIVVLSYVTSASPSEAGIKSFFESKFANVSIHTTEHNHALSRSKKRELLFVGIP